MDLEQVSFSTPTAANSIFDNASFRGRFVSNLTGEPYSHGRSNLLTERYILSKFQIPSLSFWPHGKHTSSKMKTLSSHADKLTAESA